jgi:hypothetical protein
LRRANRGILDRTQGKRVDLLARKRVAGRNDLRRAQQTADVVGAEERLHHVGAVPLSASSV